MNPMKRLPQSPRKMVAGLKLKRRKPRIEPARARAISETRAEPETRATANTTMVEKRAEPAANPSKSINEVESIGDGEDPQHGKRKANEPGKMVTAEKYRQVEDAKAAGKQHCARHSLNCNFYVRAEGMNVIINAEREDQTTGEQDREQRFD